MPHIHKDVQTHKIIYKITTFYHWITTMVFKLYYCIHTHCVAVMRSPWIRVAAEKTNDHTVSVTTLGKPQHMSMFGSTIDMLEPATLALNSLM